MSLSVCRVFPKSMPENIETHVVSSPEIDFIVETSLEWSLYCRSQLFEGEPVHGNSLKSLRNFSDLAVNISKFFLERVKKSGFENFRCVCAKDGTNNLLAIGVFEIKFAHVDVRYLLSNPKHFNIDEKGFFKKTQYSGAALNVLRKIISIAEVLNCSKVTLNALPDAESFYLKAGFSFEESQRIVLGKKTMVLNLRSECICKNSLEFTDKK